MIEFYEPRKKKPQPLFNLNLKKYLNPQDKPIGGIVSLLLTGALSVAMIVFIMGRQTPSEAPKVPVEDTPAVAEVSASDTETEAGFAGYPEDEAWKLTLVNRWNKVDSDYGSTIKFVQLRGELRVDERMYPDLQAMMDACRADNLYPVVCAAYRSISDQQQRYSETYSENKRKGLTDEEAKIATEEYIAIPGGSEHHLGLAVDIASENYQFFDEGQEDTYEQQWLIKNCWKYGFILRYPTDKKDITGINYEPWHYRYVGKEAAEYITQNNLTLEEFTEQMNKNSSSKPASNTSESSEAE